MLCGERPGNLRKGHQEKADQHNAKDGKKEQGTGPPPASKNKFHNNNKPSKQTTASAVSTDTKPHVPVDNSHKLCNACEKIPFSPDCMVSVEGKEVCGMRDTGATMTIVTASLVPEKCWTGKSVTVTLATLEKKSLPTATVEIDSPYFKGTAEVVAMEKPVSPVLIGNYWTDSAGKISSVPVYPVREVVAAVQTRASTGKQDRKRPSLPASLAGNVTPEDLAKAQAEDPTLSSARKLAKEKKKEQNGEHKAYYQWEKNLLYRVYQHGNKVYKQIVVPKKYRQEVLRIAHDIPMSGHLGIKKTKERIWSDFVWPGICRDVRNYCASCDICQRTTPRGKTRKVPLGKMPIIDTPFERVAVDLIGPITPCSDGGHRYIVTMVDYATRYVEAKPLKTAKAEEVAEALWEIWTRVGVPKEILTDRGSQFVGDLANEVNRLLCVKGLTTTPYHAQGNGLVEKYNGTIKTMLKRLCQEQPKEWDRFIPALLFAIREVPQESLQYSPFELLYGRQVRGPMQIMKELWTKQEQTEEVRTTFQYVLDLRNRIEDTCKIARENLSKASQRQAKYFNKKAKQRKFNVGDKVLILLADKKNKLQMSWKGPYVVMDVINDHDYKIMVGNKEKVYHANILKKYITRIDTSETHIVAVVMMDESEPATTDTAQIPLLPLERKEGPDDVNISEHLQPKQQEHLKKLCHQYEETLSDIPGRTSLVECEIPLEHDRPIHVRQYPLPHSKIDVIGDEVDAMLKLGVIEPAASPYSAPIVLVQKKDGSNRFCLDYRKLNQATIFDAEPMPDVDHLFAKLGNKKFYSKLDLCKGYWAIPIKESERDKTSFTCAQGQFRWVTLPFGLKNSGAIFSRMMRKLLRPLKQEAVSNFMDDMIIATETWEEHVQVLEAVLARLKECNLRAKPSKCYFGYEKLSFLGHEVDRGTIRPEEDKLEKIQKAQPPQTKKELRSFLGLANYYRKFVPNFATIALPLTDRTKKGHPDRISWDEDSQQAFDTLKRELCSKPVVIMPDKTKPYTLRTDASDRGVGAVLLQEHGEELHPVAYASRKLSGAETRYATIEKECLAIVWGVKKFEPFLFGTQFTIQTDHQPLQYLRKTKTENGRLMRWAIQLQQYNFSVAVIPGKDNVGADFLSRATYSS